MDVVDVMGVVLGVSVIAVVAGAMIMGFLNLYAHEGKGEEVQSNCGGRRRLMSHGQIVSNSRLILMLVEQFDHVILKTHLLIFVTLLHVLLVDGVALLLLNRLSDSLHVSRWVNESTHTSWRPWTITFWNAVPCDASSSSSSASSSTSVQLA